MQSGAKDITLAARAGMLCNNLLFRRFVAASIEGRDTRSDSMPMPLGPTVAPATPIAAAEFVRRACGVKSRRDLDTNQAAANRFDALRTDFDAWRGRIGRSQ